MWGLGRLALMTGTAVAGWLVAVLSGAQVLVGSSGYLVIATTLLVVGLYSSTHGISIPELRVGVRTVVLAVTVGVLVKAALIAGAMYLVFQEPRYAVLGLAVAQIDPLAVAAMNRGSRMSDRAKALLAAWASFDDPITVVLTVYGAAWLLGRGTAGGGPFAGGGAAGSLGVGIAQNLLLAGLALAVWTALRQVRRRSRVRAGPGGAARTRPPGRAVSVVELVLLALLLGVAVAYSLALGVALLGLFFRPLLTRWLDGFTQAAFLTACFLLGLALADGVELWAGLLLGLCAFTAQVVVGLVIPARIGRRDRAYLAAGQQNGITAIILALLLEPAFPGTIGSIAPAILVVAVLHAVTNGILDARFRPANPGVSARAATPPGPATVDPDTARRGQTHAAVASGTTDGSEAA